MDLYPYACPTSPIALLTFGSITPRSITPKPYIGDVIMWNESMLINQQDVIDHNTDWVYVPSFPLRANIVLIDPSAAELAVDSRIVKACICRVKLIQIQTIFLPLAVKVKIRKKLRKMTLSNG